MLSFHRLFLDFRTIHLPFCHWDYMYLMFGHYRVPSTLVQIIRFLDTLSFWLFASILEHHASLNVNFTPCGLFLQNSSVVHFSWWGDGTSRNDVSPYECSGTPGPQIIRPVWHNFPGLIHLCRFDHIYSMYCIMQIMTGMYQSRDTVFLGRLIWGTRGPRTFVRGNIVSGRPVPPPFSCLSNYSLPYSLSSFLDACIAQFCKWVIRQFCYFWLNYSGVFSLYFTTT